MGVIVSLSVEVLEYAAKVGRWILAAPVDDSNDLDIRFEVPVYWYGERIGVFKCEDDWWTFNPGQ